MDQNDVGKPKVLAVKNNIERFQDDVRVDIVNLKIEDIDTLTNNGLLSESKFSFIVGVADTPANKIRAVLTQYALMQNIPIGFCGVGIRFGSIGPLLYDSQSKISYMKSQNTRMACLYEPITKGSISFTNTIISSMLAQEIFFSLTGIKSSICLDTEILFDLDEMKIVKSLSVVDLD